MIETFLPPSRPTLLDSLVLEIAQQLTPNDETLGDRIKSDVDEQIVKVYGSRAVYDDVRIKLGMSEDHAWQFERYGVVLQPKQIEFAVWARRCDDPDGPVEVGMGGARGPGKTFGVFAQTALDDCQRFPGLKVLYLRKTASSASEQLEDIATNVLRYMPGAKIAQGRIRFPNGSRIIIGGFNTEAEALKYQGIENDVLIIEEATQLSGNAYKTIRLSNRSSKKRDGKQWRPRTYPTTNPLGIGHQAFKKRFVDNERKCLRGEKYDRRRKFIFATVDDNVFVNPEYVDNLEDLTGVEYRAYRLGDWDVSAGAYFESWNSRLHVIRPVDDITYMVERWCSMDFGFNHWNLVYLHVMDGDGVIYTIDELAHRKYYPEEIAPQLKAWLAKYGLTVDDLSCFLVGNDAFSQTGRAKATIAQQYEAEGISLSRADATPGSRVAGALLMSKLLGNLDRRIHPRWYITSRCPKLIDVLPYLERDPKNAEDVLKINADEQGNGGDDPYDGARYGIYRPHVTQISTG